MRCGGSTWKQRGSGKASSMRIHVVAVSGTGMGLAGVIASMGLRSKTPTRRDLAFDPRWAAAHRVGCTLPARLSLEERPMGRFVVSGNLWVR
jgi:hypothetical protein